MGKQSTKTSKTTYGNTTTSNPYAIAKTDNSGTVANFQPGSALESIYNFVNSNMNSLLDEYLNPNLTSTANQAKLKAYSNTLENTSRNNLENSVINPLSKRNMLRSSQAADLYKNLASQNAVSLDNYITDLLSTAQDQSASMINNLLQMYMKGYDVLSNMSDKSLNTSSGNATKTISGNDDPLLEALRSLANKRGF